MFKINKDADIYRTLTLFKSKTLHKIENIFVFKIRN